MVFAVTTIKSTNLPKCRRSILRPSAIEVTALVSSETRVNFYQTSLRYIALKKKLLIPSSLTKSLILRDEYKNLISDYEFILLDCEHMKY